MFVVHSLPLAIFFCILTMLGWGSWANTQKLAGRAKWPFELFYWDYAAGVLLTGVVFALTLGSFGPAGVAALRNLQTAGGHAILIAMWSGAIFNLANLLLVAGIDAAGMSVAFPVGVGLALVIGTVESFIDTPKGNAISLFGGVGLIVLAMAMSALAHSRLPRQAGRRKVRGLVFSVIAGCIMGLFYPQLMHAISPAFNTDPIQPELLTPYAALACFGAGVFVSNFVWNSIFMRSASLTVSDYTAGAARLHAIGILGGAIWMLALAFNVVASGVAGPAISYALGQGATLVASLWGLLIWREFRAAPPGTTKFIALSLVWYAVGLALIGVAST